MRFQPNFYKGSVREHQMKYIIITPMFNEERYIEKTIRSVLSQTIKPIQWIIVDDGSLDQSKNIVSKYLKDNNWIRLLDRKRVPGQTYYSSNVFAINYGIEEAGVTDYEYLAILDADIELVENYYEQIYKKMTKFPELGIATGVYQESHKGKIKIINIDRRSTPKALQVFRRECFEVLGGYIPFKYGGEDSRMEIAARLNGWETWSFPSIVVTHNRPLGTGNSSGILKARINLGKTDYCLSMHPLFIHAKCVKRAFIEKPYILSGLLRLLGYYIAALNRLERQLPENEAHFVRREQMSRLFPWIKGRNNWFPEGA